MLRGPTRAFDQTVREVCYSCNNGWLSTMEQAVIPVLGRVLTGDESVIQGTSSPLVEAWVQKTVLVAMLMSSTADRARGYGVPREDYRLFFDRDERHRPLPGTRSWAAMRRSGDDAGLWVVPQSKQRGHSPAPSIGYLSTVLLGRVIIQQLRPIDTQESLDVVVPSGFTCLNEKGGGQLDTVDLELLDLPRLATGRETATTIGGERIGPWAPASDLPASMLRGSWIEMPSICGIHVLNYPAQIAQEAIDGRSSWFAVSCPCGDVYLIHADRTGAKLRASGDAPYIDRLWRALNGYEHTFRVDGYSFTVLTESEESERQN